MGDARPGRRVRRKLWRAAVFFTLSLAVAYVVLTRTGVTRRLVLPALARALDLEIAAGSVVVTADLRLRLTDVVFRLPGLEGPGGELVRVARAEVTPRWLATAVGRPGVSRLELFEPLVRVSRDRLTGRLNVSEIDIGGGQQAGAIGRLPAVLVLDGRVEIGEHDGASFERVAMLRGDGALASAPGGSPGLGRGEGRGGGDGAYVLTFDGLVEGVADQGRFSVAGRLDGSGLGLSFEGLTIGRVDPRLVPPEIRGAFERLRLEGSVTPRRVEIGADGVFTAEVGFMGVALDVPATERPGSVDRLRLTGVTGSLSLGTQGGGRLISTLTGRAGPITYDAEVDAWGLGGSGDRSPASLVRLRARPFWLDRDVGVLAFAPASVLEHLRMFSDPTGLMWAEIWLGLGRAPEGAERVATAGLAAPVSVIERAAGGGVALFGRVWFEDGRAAFRGFPYEFGAMSGSFAFEERSLWIEEVRGVSASGARIRANGKVAPLAEDAGVDLLIVVDDIGLDDDLRGAMSEPRRRALDMLFSESRHAELVGGGLVATPAEGRRITARLDELRATRRAWALGVGVAPAERAAIDRETAELEARLAATPAFELGGRAIATISLHRAPQVEPLWSNSIVIELPEAGLVPEPFPVPLIGRGIRLEIGEDSTRLVEGQYRTLSGGEVTIRAVVPTTGEDGDFLPPTVEILARDVPIDPTLLNATARATDEASRRGGTPFSLGDVFERARISGRVNCAAAIGPRGVDGGVGDELSYRIEVGIEDAAAIVPGDVSLGDGPLLVRGFGLDVVVDDDGVSIAGRGRVAGEGGDATMGLEARINAGGPGPAVSFKSRVEGLDLNRPIEKAVDLFVPGFEAQAADVRADLRPSGRLTLETEVVVPTDSTGAGVGGQAPPEPWVTVAIEAIERLGLSLGGRRIEVQSPTGRAGFVSGPLGPGASIGSADSADSVGSGGVNGLAVWADGLDGPLWINGDPLGRLTAHGRLVRGADDGGGGLWLGVEGVDLSSRAAVESARWVAPELAGEMERRAISGRMGLSVRLTGAPGAREGDQPTESGVIRFDDGRVVGRARVNPDSLAFDTGRGRVEIPELSGLVEVWADGGRIERLEGRGAGWEGWLGGAWSLEDDGSLLVEGTGGMDAGGVPEAARRALPGVITQTLDGLGMRIDGRTRLSGASVSVARRPGGDTEFNVSGALEASGVSLSVGLPIESMNGMMRYEAWRAPVAVAGAGAGGGPIDEGFRLGIEADRLRVAGIEMTSATAEVVSGLADGEVLVPRARASAHGGTIEVSARVLSAGGEGVGVISGETGGDGFNAGGALEGLLEDGLGPGYWARVRAWGVSLASLLASGVSSDPIGGGDVGGDVGGGGVGGGGGYQARADAGADAGGGNGGGGGAVPTESNGEPTRATLELGIDLAGPIGEDASGTRGRGSVVVRGGPVVNLPLVLPLIEASNLLAPVGNELDAARASFFIDGPLLSFSQIELSSGSVSLVGSGTMDWRLTGLDLRFRSRATGFRVPVISGALESFRDELITTRVTGTLAEPRFSTESLAVTRDLLGGLLGRPSDESLDTDRRLRAEGRGRPELPRGPRTDGGGAGVSIRPRPQAEVGPGGLDAGDGGEEGDAGGPGGNDRP